MASKIVIIGGGYGGVWTFRSLESTVRRLIRKGEVEISLICPKTYHSYHGWTAEALTGIVAVGNRQSPLRPICSGHLVQGMVVSVDLDAQSVLVQLLDGRLERVPYDHLVFANGSYDAVESVPGLDEHGWSVKAPGGVQATRNQLIRSLEEADAVTDPEALRAYLTVVVAGGGFAGVEISANIAEMYQALRRYYPVLHRASPRIVLAHSGAELLPVLRPRFRRLADYCTKQLREYGVELRLGQRLTLVAPGMASFSDGTAIPCRNVIATTGQRLTTLPGTDRLPRTARGQIETDDVLRVRGYENIWAAGDTAHVLRVDGTPSPTNALWAIKHGTWAGENIGRTLLGKPPRKFTYRGLGQAASLGIGRGAVELYGLQFTGWLGWFLRLSFFLYFQPSRAQATRILMDWLSLRFLGRYLTSSPEWRHEPDPPPSVRG